MIIARNRTWAMRNKLADSRPQRSADGNGSRQYGICIVSTRCVSSVRNRSAIAAGDSAPPQSASFEIADHCARLQKYRLMSRIDVDEKEQWKSNRLRWSWRRLISIRGRQLLAEESAHLEFKCVFAGSDEKFIGPPGKRETFEKSELHLARACTCVYACVRLLNWREGTRNRSYVRLARRSLARTSTAFSSCFAEAIRRKTSTDYIDPNF